MERQRTRRIDLEEEKRALTYSPSGMGGRSTGSGTRRRINFNSGGGGAYDSPRSGTSSMYTDEKGLTIGVGGVTVTDNRKHMLLGGDIPQQSQTPIDLLDSGGINEYGQIVQQTPSIGEMSV